MKKILFSLIFFVFHIAIFSQNKPRLIKGFIKDSLGIVVDANILNLKTLEGSFSSELGVFEISASKGDSILISSLPHISKKIKITDKNYNEKQIEIVLKIDITILDEIELKHNNLLGILHLDTKNVPVNVRDSILNENIEYIEDSKKTKLLPEGTNTNLKPPKNNVDPTSKFVGVGTSIDINNESIERKKALKNHLAYRKVFPKILLNDLGEDFFFVQLKIPKERYYHFLDYCNPLGIEKLYKANKKIEVIKILKKEHITYLKKYK